MSSNFVLACAATSVLVGVARAQSTVRVGVTSNGLQSIGDSYPSTLSADGRYVAFSSAAGDLVQNDTNALIDVFVHDRWTGVTELVSVSTTGARANDDCSGGCLSGGGRCVAFSSQASTLVAGDTNGRTDVFVHDRETHVTVRASVAADGAQGNDNSGSPSLTHDGGLVCFKSRASNLVPFDTNLTDDIFVKDLWSGTIERASVSSTGVQSGPFEPSMTPLISPDGRFVTFASHAPGFAPGDTGTQRDIFLRDRVNGTTEIVNLAHDGAFANDMSDCSSVSLDGRYVVFHSRATNLVPGDTNGAFDVFLRDRVLGTLRRVSTATNGGQADGTSYVPCGVPGIAADGSRIVFQSYATNLVGDDGNWVYDVFVHEVASGETSLVSVSSSGDLGHQPSAGSAISADGRCIAFTSLNPFLVAGDTNGVADAFVRDLGSACEPIRATCVAKTNSAGCAPSIGASGEPRLSGPDAFYISATQVLASARGRFVWSTTRAWLPFAGGILCEGGALVRTPVQMSSAGQGGGPCSGTYSFHFSQAHMNAHGLGAGTTVRGQFISRDVGFAPPDDIGLTDAIEFTICP